MGRAGRPEGLEVSVDWKLVADLPPGELLERLSAEADRLFDGRSDPDEDELLAHLPEPLRAVWLIDWLDYEVSQGSLLAYFFNSHGRHAPLTIDLLRRMGAFRVADVLSAAAESHAQASAEWQARHDELDALGEDAVVTPYAGLSNGARLNELTDRFWQAAVVDDWSSRLDAYLSAQVKLLAQ